MRVYQEARFQQYQTFMMLTFFLFLLQVMQESLMMIPDSHRRLEKAYAELKALVDAEEAEMAEAKEFQEAKAVLAEADEQLKAS